MLAEEISKNFHDLIIGFDYKKQRTYADKVSVHAQGKFFDFLLVKHLYEDEETINWRKLNWVSASTPGFNRAFNTLSRIFRDSEFNAIISDELTLYLADNKFHSVNFFTYAANYLMRDMIEDPNSLIAIFPYNLENKLSSDRVSLMIKNISSYDVSYLDNSTLIWKCVEKSKVKDGNREYWGGDVYRGLNESEYFEIRQIGKKSDNKFELEIIYTHNIGFLPAFVCGGDWSREGYYKSFFDGYLHFGNEALKQYSDYQFVCSKTAYPIRELADIDCEAEGCENGRIYDYVDGERTDKWHRCGVCGGSGKIDLSGVSKTLIRPRASHTAPLDERPMLSYIAPPTDVLQFMQQAWELSLKKAEESLQLNFVEEAQSGVAKAMDRDEHRAFLMRIAINYYDNIIFNSLLIMEYYINPNSQEIPKVLKPLDFNTNSEDSLEDDIQKFTTLGLNSMTAVSMDKLFPKKSGGNTTLLKMLEFIRWFDPLYADTESQKVEKYMSELVSKQIYNNSIYVKNALDKLVYEKGSKEFEAMDFQRIKDYVLNIINEYSLDEAETEEEETENENENNNLEITENDL